MNNSVTKGLSKPNQKTQHEAATPRKDKLKRRDFLKTSLVAGAAGLVEGSYPVNLHAAPAAAPEVAKGVTRSVAEFAINTRFEDIPGNVNDFAKKSILDGIGLALFGSTQDTAEIISRYMAGMDCVKAGSTVIGSSTRFPQRFAAFANGVAIHVGDYDDTQLATAKDRVYGLLTHPTVPVLPAVLALAEKKNTSGKDFLAAYQVGVEVECKIAEAIAPRHYQDGFHSTGTCGVFGGVVAASRMRGFDVKQTIRAMGIAGSQASGLRENFGSMMKPFHAGHAAEVGVFSTELAALGWTATETILEAPRGFFHAYGGSFDLPTMQRMGNPWTFADPGVSIKPYPCGSLTHPAMDEVAKLIRQYDLHPADIEMVEVGTNKQNLNALIHHHPQDALQAKFSMEFCVAILLLERKAGLREFTDEVVNRPDVQAMISKVKFGVDPVAESSGYDKMTSIIKIKLKDGRTVGGSADFAKGSPANPMSNQEVADKFFDCCSVAHWPLPKAKAIVQSVYSLERMADVSSLTALCRK